ncbi:MAG TPA: N-acetylmuramoyl-L-alanine amidase, partial [Rubrobacteraceae bacterium]|nr:N-acetylmuramoyl-L-alanine amidase [Rubrobacteraceae bacterium]
MNRKNFLRLSGGSLAGAVLLGTTGGGALAQTGSPLKAEFESAAERYRVPLELLMAMAYVNTLWEMPPPSATPYREGDLHGRGAYGIMQLVQNPSRDTLEKAASLTRLSEEKLKNSRAANVRGGAAVLAEMQGEKRPSDLNAWQEAVSEYGDSDLYAVEVFQTLQEGASETISTGETLSLPAQEEAEVPAVFTAQGKADYRRATWRPAYWNGARKCVNSINYCRASRGAGKIDYIVVHVAEGSYSGTISWFKDRRAGVSAHYVVGREGQVAQCVRNKDIAYHAGNWWYNQRSIGIEHAGYGSNRRTWTDSMYRESARLSAYLSRRYGIPVNDTHIVRHRKVVATKCPGRHFDMDRYLRLVRRFK